MTPLEVGLLGFGALAGLIFLGFHVSTALLVVAFVGTWYLRGDAHLAGTMLGLAATDAVSQYEFGVIPLFVLMGMFAMVSGIGQDAYALAHARTKGLRGGLAYATVFANAIFASIIGVSIAAAVLFTKIAVPEMLRHNYPKQLAVGVVAASSLLGMLIPPSLLMVLYAILTETSIGDLYKAALVPSAILVFTYCAAIYVMSRRHWGPGTPLRDQVDQALADDKGPTLARVLPIPLVVVLVLGGIYAGVFTATESAAVGAAGVMVLAWRRKSLDARRLWQALYDTASVSASLILIIAAASMFSRFVALTGLPTFLGNWMEASQLSLASVLVVYVIVLLLLGMVIDSTSTMLIAVPLFVLMFQTFNVDMVWIGMITVVAVEIGLLTPPLGLSVFVVKASLTDPRISLRDVFMGAAPFVVSALVTLTLVVIFPSLSRVWF